MNSHKQNTADQQKVAWLSDAINSMPAAWVRDQGVWSNLHILYGQGCTVKEALERLKTALPRLLVAIGTTALSLEDRKELALDAMVNWCWNTEKHLTEARRLKAVPVRSTVWHQMVRGLMAAIQYQVGRAEPDTLSALNGHWPFILTTTFIAAIPDAD